ncbi:MAG: DUF5054 domain-containing protein [Acidimicrobiales bacterium]
MVHVVAKTHLDLGFTALAAEVEARYLEDFFPRALAVAAELAAGDGPERLVWTTGSWIVHRALGDRVAARADAVAEGIRAGHLAWHALPVTTHTELADAGLVRAGLAISAELDARFGRRTTAAKMTDVPGHTRGLVPLLAEAGVTFLHLGVNPAWPVPDVPPTFRWRSSSGAEVVVAYQAGGYGGEVVVSGCDQALAFLHAGDNLGPPTTAEVRAAWAELAARHPGAEVRASTLDAFARALAASGAVDGLPVVTAEIGDPWLFGVGSDPVKVAGLRRALSARLGPTAPAASGPLADGDDVGRVASVERRLLLAVEHTWGLDQKVVLPDELPWDDAALAALRASPAGRRFEASWSEQRAYVDDALLLLGAALDPPPELPDDDAALADLGFEPLAVGQRVAPGGWVVEVGGDGALHHLALRSPARVLADADHPLGLVHHQSFDEADYERFYAGLRPEPHDEWWARRDNTKPGIGAAGATSGWVEPTVRRVAVRPVPAVGAAELLVDVALLDHQGAAAGQGAPPLVRLLWGLDGAGRRASLSVWWEAKPATRLPEATWCSFVPIVAAPERWTMDKLGEPVSPLDVVRRGGRALHAVGAGLAYDGPDGHLSLRTPDAPLVAPGAPRLLDADPPVPDLAGGFHVLLHDNCWGTNFPMWFEGPACFRFHLDLAPRHELGAETDL